MTYALIALAVLLSIDWQQTLRIARNPDRWHEMNPILGRHPSTARVHVWFAICAIGVALAVWLLRPDLALGLVLLFAAAEVACVLNNLRAGLSV